MIKKRNLVTAGVDFVEVLTIAFGVFIFAYFFIAQLLKVNGTSMLPTLQDGEQILAEKVTIKINALNRGEIIIFEHPQKPGVLLVKRVIGLPGERIKIFEGNVYINDMILDEDYLPYGTQTPALNFLGENKTFQIPQNSYMLMGDNRKASSDSRDWGPVNSSTIVGRAVLIYYPLSNFRFI
jgi:signal peptidase I